MMRIDGAMPGIYIVHWKEDLILIEQDGIGFISMK